MLQKSGRLVLWEAMFILELHSAETQEKIFRIFPTFFLDFPVIVAVITIQKRMRKIALSEFFFCMALNSCKYL